MQVVELWIIIRNVVKSHLATFKMEAEQTSTTYFLIYLPYSLKITL